MNRLLKTTFILSSVLVTANISAQESDGDDLFDMSLDELMNITVISSSGIEESLIDAPAAMWVVHQQDIEKRGYNNLMEVMSDLPGFDSVITGQSVPSNHYQRGYRTPSTTRTLLLVDGKVDNHLWNHRAYLSRQYPISMIQRIEVLYGPASVVYGPNAFLGVINIITKSGEDLAENQHNLSVKADIGSWNSKAAEINVAGRIKDFSYDISARVSHSDEEDLSSRWGFLSNDLYSDPKVWGPLLELENDGHKLGSYVDDSNNYSFYARAKYKGLELKYSRWENNEGYGAAYAADRGQSNGDWIIESEQYAMEHEFQFTQKLQVITSILYRESNVGGNWAEATPDWNAGMEEYSYVSFSHANSANNVSEMSQQFDYQLDDKQQLMFGWRYKKSDLTRAYDWPGYWGAYSSTVPVTDTGPHGFGAAIYHSSDPVYSYTARPLDDVPEDNRSKFKDVGVYGAWIKDIGNWRTNVGVRYDDNEIWGAAVSPRASAIYKFNEGKSAVKLLYGEAFQEPPAQLLYGGWSGRRANPDMKSEETSNVEIVFMHSTENWLHDISFFRTDYNNVVREDADNDTERVIQGVEYRGQFLFQHPFKSDYEIRGNLFYSYHDPETNQTYDHDAGSWTYKDDHLGDIAPHKIHLLFDIPLTDKLNWNIKMNYHHRAELYSRNPLTLQGIEASSRTFVDTNFNYQNGPWNLSFKVLNLFDKEVLAPGVEKADSGNDFTQRSKGFRNSLLPQPGRSFWFSMSYKLEM